MSTSFVSSSIRSALLLAAAVLAACGGGSISGVYAPDGDGFFEQMLFKSNGKVEITFMGMTKEGTFEVEGEKVKVTNAGDTQVFTIDDDGCLDGGGLIGRYCKSK